MQDAVPPRISGPYEGIQRTSRSSFIAARARTLPANRIPWPPKPAKMIERSIVSASWRRCRSATRLRTPGRSTITPGGTGTTSLSRSIDSTGVMPQPTGQLLMTSTIANPRPSSWTSQARWR